MQRIGKRVSKMLSHRCQVTRYEKKVGDKGKMFVALDGKKVVGTYAVLIRNNRKWFTSGDYAYECFCTVLPEYRRTRAYFLLARTAIGYIKKKGLSLTTGEAHENNDKDSFQNGSRKRTGETFWYINLNIT